jgi:hypothetical protein
MLLLLPAAVSYQQNGGAGTACSVSWPAGWVFLGGGADDALTIWGPSGGMRRKKVWVASLGELLGRGELMSSSSLSRPRMINVIPKGLVRLAGCRQSTLAVPHRWAGISIMEKIFFFQ